jgi:hypothetical protein
MSIWIEVVEPFTVKEHGQVSSWQVGQRMVLSPEKVQRIIDRVGSKVRVVNQQTMDHAIGTVVQASLEFQTEAGMRVTGTGPWIVADVTVVENEPDLLAGRWLLLVHGLDWRWSHESRTTPSRCPTCKGARFWWSANTVLCIQCVPPSAPKWPALWREVAALSAGILVDDLRYASLWDALQQCDDAFKAGDYARFQSGVIRVRRAVQELTKLDARK